MLADNSAQILLNIAIMIMMTITRSEVAINTNIYSKGEININSIRAPLPWLWAVDRRILTLAFRTAKSKMKISPNSRG